MPKLALGLDLGGTKLAAALVDGEGRTRWREEVATAVEEGPRGVIRQMTTLVERGRALCQHLLGIGIGVPGPVNLETGELIYPPNLPGWKRVNLRRPFAELGLPVFLNNDANCAALAEHTFGAARGHDHALYLTISTGVGGGLILDGKLYMGAGGYGGELGHVIVRSEGGNRCGCGSLGCLEAHCSGTALAKAAAAAAARKPKSFLGRLQAAKGRLTARDVFEGYKRGDSECRRIFQRFCDDLGVGLASMVTAFNPSVVVLGGGVSQHAALFIPPVRKAVKAHCMKPLASMVAIKKARVRDHGVVGAASLVWAGWRGVAAPRSRG